MSPMIGKSRTPVINFVQADTEFLAQDIRKVSSLSYPFDITKKILAMNQLRGYARQWNIDAEELDRIDTTEYMEAVPAFEKIRAEIITAMRKELTLLSRRDSENLKAVFGGSFMFDEKLPEEKEPL